MAITNKDIDKLKEAFATKEEMDRRFDGIDRRFKEVMIGQDRIIKEAEDRKS